MTCTILAIIVILIGEISPQDPVITHPPVDTVGCLGGKSVFNCFSNRSYVHTIGWTINGKTEYSKEEREIVIHSDISSTSANSTLTIAGLPHNNDTRIACTVAIEGPSSEVAIQTQEVIFTVYEVPPVSNIAILDNQAIGLNELVTVEWTRPSCVPENYTYLVTVNNGTDVIKCNTTIDSQYSVEVSPCYNYSIDVMVVDTYRPQFNSSVTTVEIPVAEHSPGIEILNVLVEFKNKASSMLSVLIQIMNATCQVYLYQHTTSLVPPDTYQQNDSVKTDVSNNIDRATGKGVHSVGPFNKSFIGQLNLSTDTDSSVANFSTHNVQKVDVIQYDEKVNIRCTFANGSHAEGCAVMFSDMLIVNITKPSKLNTATCNITVSEGVYTISAFDIIDGKRSDHQAFELRDRFTVSVVPTKRFTSSSSTTGLTIGMSQLTPASKVYSTPTFLPTGEESNIQYILAVVISPLCLAVMSLIVIVTFAVTFAVYVIRKRARQKARYFNYSLTKQFLRPLRSDPPLDDLGELVKVEEKSTIEASDSSFTVKENSVECAETLFNDYHRPHPPPSNDIPLQYLSINSIGEITVNRAVGDEHCRADCLEDSDSTLVNGKGSKDGLPISQTENYSDSSGQRSTYVQAINQIPPETCQKNDATDADPFTTESKQVLQHLNDGTDHFITGMPTNERDSGLPTSTFTETERCGKEKTGLSKPDCDETTKENMDFHCASVFVLGSGKKS